MLGGGLQTGRDEPAAVAAWVAAKMRRQARRGWSAGCVMDRKPVLPPPSIVLALYGFV